MMETNMKTDTNIKLPISFILYGLAALVVSQLILFLNSSDLIEGQFRIPDIWMAVHFLMLGFAVMTAMGAMYQLVPVAFLTPIWNQTFGFIQFFITAVGMTLFAILLGFHTNIAIYGGILAIIGILMFLFQMIKTISVQKEKTTMTYFILVALVSFLLTITAGFILAWNLAFGDSGYHENILYSHITLGIAGWFTLLIFGMSYKLVPMFSLSHGFTMKWAKPALYTYIGGLVVTIISYWVHMSTVQSIGFFLLFAGFGLFSLDMKEILSKRIKKKLDQPFQFSLFAIFNGLIIHFLALLIVLLDFTTENVWPWLIYLYIVTWIVFSILGYLYKIVPFLWWTHKYSEKVGKEKVPTLKEMMNEKLSGILYSLFIVSVLGIIISIGLKNGISLYGFTGLMTATSCIYAISIIKVLLK
ncbi:hypothetical protein [Caldifermentibacillus hisashii]|uniref:hypothetical protein n=1 Tax=Caldifermentibacillus hisashii TaxID=996558 RepID=UPI001C10F261|nr:hypothetical protein [Caldifermentibacillus hisashii]MBU5342410.1 hypothetical protein [Caldifermentibacillus hisashii]